MQNLEKTIQTRLSARMSVYSKEKMEHAGNFYGVKRILEGGITLLSVCLTLHPITPNLELEKNSFRKRKGRQKSCPAL